MFMFHLNLATLPSSPACSSWVTCSGFKPDKNIKATALCTTFLSIVSLLALLKKKKKALHKLTFSQHTSLFSSLLLLLWLTAYCTSPTQQCYLLAVLASPHPSLPPTRLLIHPFREQYRRELMTIITLAISYNALKKKSAPNRKCIWKMEIENAWCIDHIKNE